MPNRDKVFLTLDEQAELLRSRGMKVEDADKVTLAREGYYSVVNGYKDAFIDPQATSEAGEDRYREGTTFEHLHLLFDLDRMLKENTFPLLVRAETTFRTALAYSFSDRNRGHDAYLDPSSFCEEWQYHERGLYATAKGTLLNTLQRARNNRKHPAIAHYLENYGHVPLWVLVNVLTFGNTSHLYALSTPQVQNDVCRMIADVQGLGRIGTARLRKTVFTLVDFRNICAHDDRLYCARAGGHMDKTFADMLVALRVLVEERYINDYLKEAGRTLRLFDRVPNMQNEVLSKMRVELTDEGIRPVGGWPT